LRSIVLLLAILFPVLSCPVSAQETAPVYSQVMAFTLDLPTEEAWLSPILLSSSRLHENNGKVVRSMARLDANVQTDEETFRLILRSEGYFGAQIDHRLARTGSTVSATIAVAPGKRYRLGNVSLNIIGADELEAALQQNLEQMLSSGAPARAEEIVQTELAIEIMMSNRGYPFAATGERKVVVDHATHRVNVQLNIAAGMQVRFARIIFDGLEKTDEEYMLRQVPWKQGAPFSQKMLDEFRKRLVTTGLFNAVTVNVKPTENIGETPAIMVSVSEALRRRIELGGGYSTGEGFEAEATWLIRNIGGRGQSLRLTSTLSESEQSLAANLKRPHFGRYNQVLSLSARIGRENRPAFVSHVAETTAGISRPIAKNLTAGIGLEASLTELRDNGFNDTFGTLSLPLGLGFDSANSLFNPSNGLRFNIRVQPNVSIGDDTVTYLTGEVKASAYKKFKALDRVTFAVRGRLGATWGQDTIKIPVTERFFAGGGGSVRGYSYQALGDIDPDGDPTGGRSVAEVAFEARLKVSDTIGIIPFIDGGAVYNSQLPTFDAFRWGVGVGLQYQTQIIPIRLDVAFPIDKRSEDAALAIYISLGQSF